jgi:hypothetical protein
MGCRKAVCWRGILGEASEVRRKAISWGGFLGEAWESQYVVFLEVAVRRVLLHTPKPILEFIVSFLSFMHRVGWHRLGEKI